MRLAGNHYLFSSLLVDNLEKKRSYDAQIPPEFINKITDNSVIKLDNYRINNTRVKVNKIKILNKIKIACYQIIPISNNKYNLIYFIKFYHEIVAKSLRIQRPIEIIIQYGNEHSRKTSKGSELAVPRRVRVCFASERSH